MNRADRRRGSAIPAVEEPPARVSRDQQILRLPAKDALADHADLIHAPCSRPFRDENLSEGYALSDLGQRLVQKSNWLTVWVTEQLVDVGVPENAILWNLAESGEEVDILLEFLGEVWIFELKDRTFSTGDAYPFNYRRARYGATKAFVVTTDHVASDAKRILRELSDQARRAAPSTAATYIEGLNSVRPTCETEVARTAVNYAGRRLQPLALSTGFDLRRLVMARFGAAETPQRRPSSTLTGAQRRTRPTAASPASPPQPASPRS
jgi:hypothetical protein